MKEVKEVEEVEEVRKCGSGRVIERNRIPESEFRKPDARRIAARHCEHQPPTSSGVIDG